MFSTVHLKLIKLSRTFPVILFPETGLKLIFDGVFFTSKGPLSTNPYQTYHPHNENGQKIIMNIHYNALNRSN